MVGNHKQPVLRKIICKLDVNRQTGKRLFHAGNGLDLGSSDRTQLGDIRRLDLGHGIVWSERHVRLGYTVNLSQTANDILHFTRADLDQNISLHIFLLFKL